MGTPNFSVPILEGLINNYNVILVVTQPDKEKDRHGNIIYSPCKKLAMDNNIEVFQPEKIREDYERIIELNPDLTYSEVYQLCSDYLLKFNKPTKEETKIKSLKKYLSKFFEIDLFADEEPKLEDIQPSMSPLQSIPKQYFQERSWAKKDYIIKIHHLDKQI